MRHISLVALNKSSTYYERQRSVEMMWITASGLCETYEHVFSTLAPKDLVGCFCCGTHCVFFENMLFLLEYCN